MREFRKYVQSLEPVITTLEKGPNDALLRSTIDEAQAYLKQWAKSISSLAKDPAPAPTVPDSAPITPQIPASNATPGTVAVSTTSAVATDTPPGKTSPLTIAAIGFAALKLLAII
jgi:hypothetical protein